MLSEDGEPATVDPTAARGSVSPTGAITQGGNVINLALVRPHSMGDLVKLGDNLFSPLAEPQNVPPGESQGDERLPRTVGRQAARWR